jgi:hypothetical protein
VIDGLRIPLPQPAGLALEKLVSIVLARRAIATCSWLPACLRTWNPASSTSWCNRSNLSILSLLGVRPGMPDPRPQRSTIDPLLERLGEP